MYKRFSTRNVTDVYAFIAPENLIVLKPCCEKLSKLTSKLSYYQRLMWHDGIGPTPKLKMASKVWHYITHSTVYTGPGRNTWRFCKTVEWNRWRGEFVLERSSSETQSISVATERWSVEHRAFAVETIFKNNDSVLTQRIFRRHFNIHRNECP